MWNRNFSFFIIIFLLEFCTTSHDLQRIAYFHKIENKIIEANDVTIDQNLRVTQQCYISDKHYGYEDDFINKSLEKMTNGNSSILGFRDLKIEYKFYLLSFGFAAGFLSIDCVTISGHAIHKKENLDRKANSK